MITVFESKQNIDKEMIEKVCKIWYNNSIQNDKTVVDAMKDAFDIYKQVKMIFKDNQEEQEYAINYFCNVLLKGEENESNSNKRQG